jgi:predicted enzyme related to lactoylglutathione lyase
MASSDAPPVGTIVWTDLTVPQAESLRDFYGTVVGWSHEPVSMGSYNDFSMVPPNSQTPVAGICHARGVNEHLPPVWMVYIMVEDLEESLERCRELGGSVLGDPRAVGNQGRYAVIRDPAGAVVGLYESVAP